MAKEDTMVGDIEKDAAIIEEKSSVESISQKEGKTFLDKVAHLLKAEVRGIERVPDEERNDDSIFSPLTMWLSTNLVIACLGTGALSTAGFGLGFGEATLSIIFMTLLGAVPVAWLATFGSKFGLRQMVLTRFLGGMFTSRIFAFLNVISCIGWSAINSIGSVELMHLVNNQKLPPAVGFVILVIITAIIALLGYDFIHVYEKWSWTPNFVIFFIIIARLKISGDFNLGEFHKGSTSAGDILTIMTIIFGFAAGWVPSVADYSVYMPRDFPSWKIFTSVFVGLSFPCIFGMVLGAALGTTTVSNPRMADLYEQQSIGGLVYGILAEDNLGRFGEFCCVILALSTIANNLPSAYSMALSFQAVWSQFQRVPRIIWCLFGNCITLAISIPAFYVFSTAMTNFLDMISYFVSIYIGVVTAEHFVFRRGFSGYNPEDYNDPSKLPIGIAGTFGFCCGVAGAVVGMQEQWYTGPLAIKIGEFGGDIGFELCVAFAFIGHCLARPLELKYFGR